MAIFSGRYTELGSNIIEFESGTGETILIEGKLAPGSPINMLTEGPIVAKGGLKKALRAVGPAVDTIISELGNSPQRPNEINVEFGLRMDASGGAIITLGREDSNFIISIKWRK